MSRLHFIFVPCDLLQWYLGVFKEAVVWMCFSKYVFFKISLISQENTLFTTLFKRDSNKGVFLWNLRNFYTVFKKYLEIKIFPNRSSICIILYVFLSMNIFWIRQLFVVPVKFCLKSPYLICLHFFEKITSHEGGFWLVQVQRKCLLQILEQRLRIFRGIMKFMGAFKGKREL